MSGKHEEAPAALDDVPMNADELVGDEVEGDLDVEEGVEE